MGWPNEDAIPVDDNLLHDHDDVIREILKNCGKSPFEIEDFMSNIDEHTDEEGFITIYDATDDTVVQMKF